MADPGIYDFFKLNSQPQAPHKLDRLSNSSSNSRLFSCLYYNHKFFTSQVLGGHHNAHMREIATTRKTLCHGDLHHRRITPVPSPRHGLAGDALRSLVTRFLLLSPTLLVPLASAVYGSRWPLRVRCKFALSFRRGSSEIPSENLALADSGGIIPFRNSPSLAAIAHALYLRLIELRRAPVLHLRAHLLHVLPPLSAVCHLRS
ncbi:C2H2 and C2HC zinc fingers superfamily protein [Perilla frutescens var. hirtella]|nr:C2H2 and C2HC zinc fingers superfamily protein [Perilla frutescens var. frutescens]KAH6775884.1 C2H2 and C2HC zinc fingers superfamily protein [Perilla frutescens var. hirtella]